MGNNYLIDGPISISTISALMKKIEDHTDTGGHSIFIGQVRADQFDNKQVKAIQYSAYEGMVKSEADKIKETVLSDYKDAKTIDILHSTGIVKAGEVSLFVLVSAGHRHQAFQACTKTVELIKEKLPVWKKEIFDDNSHIWKENK